MWDGTKQADAVGGSGRCDASGEARPLRPLPCDEQLNARQRRNRLDDDVMPLKRHKVADADDQRSVNAEASFALATRHTSKAIKVHAGVMYRCCGKAQRDHFVAQGRRYRKQSSCCMGRPADRGAGVKALSPIFDVAAACLDRERDTKVTGKPHRGRAVGEEKLRVDHVKDKPVAMESRENRSGCAVHEPGIERAAHARQQRRPRSVYLHAAANLLRRQSAQADIARVAVKRRRRQRDRADDAEVDVMARRKPNRLRLDKPAKAGLGIAGVKRRKGDYSQHRC